jgi:hypothetical protein
MFSALLYTSGYDDTIRCSRDYIVQSVLGAVTSQSRVFAEGFRDPRCWNCTRRREVRDMAVDQLPQVITPDCAFLQEVEKKSGQKISACFQCEKCSNGCPVTFAMDIVPHKILRLVNLGLKDQVLRSDTMVLRYKLKSKTYCDDMKLGIDMLKKGKLKIRPSRLRAGSQVKRIFKESKGRG